MDVGAEAFGVYAASKAATRSELGPSAHAATAAGAAAAGEFAVVAVPLKVINGMPVRRLAGKIVLDTNNYMIWRDRRIPAIDSGHEHQTRDELVANLGKARRTAVRP